MFYHGHASSLTNLWRSHRMILMFMVTLANALMSSTRGLQNSYIKTSANFHHHSIAHNPKRWPQFSNIRKKKVLSVVKNEEIQAVVSSNSDNDSGEIDQDRDGMIANIALSKEKVAGTLVLLTVPCAWGTYAPAVRYIYELETPVPGFVFSLAYYTVAAATLNLLVWGQNRNMSSSDSKAFLMDMPVKGGLELGGYLFLGNCFQVIGLESVTADRAAFLVQLTTVFVPLFQTFLYYFNFERDSNIRKKGIFEVLPPQTWFACILAFVGVLIMGIDGKELPEATTIISSNLSSTLKDFISASALSGGDYSILLASFFYTFHVIRLDKYSRETTPLKLASMKATIETIASLLLVSFLYTTHIPASASSATGLYKFSSEIQDFFHSTLAPSQISSSFMSSSSFTPVLFAVLWTGWITCAYTIYAQSYGQKRLQNPTTANLIYTSQPIFSAVFASFLLGEELGFFGYIGGSLIGISLGIIAFSQTNEN